MRTIFPALALVLLAAPMAVADELERVPPVTEPTTLKECSACHMAFQPAFLPADAWAAIMDNLSNHYGEDASLPPEATATIKNYLIAHAGSGGRGGVRTAAAAPLPRITEQRWWVREHRKLDRALARPEVKSKANCVACHRDADRGLYEDD